ncbi:MAG: hydantoinase/oxoprolinase family protein [Alphaproteobacteria bacterium]|nr:hydantoinase/oxoprolinase family protein [Alphaproteobacteria bacterium]
MAKRSDRATAKARGCRIGIDVGGTFTDFVLTDPRTGALVRYKEPSVPSDPSMSVRRGLPALLERAGVRPDEVELIVHGTTLLVNAIIQRRGAKVGLVVSRGHRGVLEIGRMSLDNSFDFTLRKEEPLVPRSRIFETSARIRIDGSVEAMPHAAEYDALADRLRKSGVEAVTVLLLNSYAHPEAEREVAEALAGRLPGVAITASAQIWPERREFERALVAIMNAYVQPIMVDYLRLLTSRISEVGIAAPVYITASNGGTLSIETARERPIDTVLSGPASGLVAATRIAQRVGQDSIITVDIGGTSCDVAFNQGPDPEYATATKVGDYPLVVPVVNVFAIGAGGGSIVWVDAQGVLKVGPNSAGADPGPICYGKGGKQPTITDCYLLVGYIHPDHFLGGRMRLDVARARAALEAVAERLGYEGEDRALRAAEAALRVASAMMATELFKGLARRGADPGEFALMAFGGAGPTHANLLAEEAGLDSIIIPPGPATFCALGAILTDVKRDYVRSRKLALRPGDGSAAELAGIFRALEERAAGWIATEGEILGRTMFDAALDMRYAGQAFDLQVAIPARMRLAPRADAIAELFHRAHERIYSFRDAGGAIEVTTQRIRVTGRIPPIEFPDVPRRPVPKPVGRRRVYVAGRQRDVAVYARNDLGRGAALDGPVIIEQEDCTVWVQPGWRAGIDRTGSILVRAVRPRASGKRSRSPGMRS